MKARKFWYILLGVVVAIVVISAVGFGFLRHWGWGGRLGAYGKMPHYFGQMPFDYDGEMPCAEEEAPVCEGFMPDGRFRGYGMTRMPHMRGGAYMHGGWGWNYFSPLTWLLLLVLVVLGVMHIGRWRHYDKYYRHGPMHMHSVHQHHKGDTSSCREDQEYAGTASEDVASQAETK